MGRSKKVTKNPLTGNHISLTPRERAWLTRRRKGLTQKEYYGCPTTGGQFEKGFIDIDPKLISVFCPPVSKIRPHEICILIRRRFGVRLADVAGVFGKSRVWVNKCERGDFDCEDLYMYWMRRLQEKPEMNIPENTKAQMAKVRKKARVRSRMYAIRKRLIEEGRDPDRENWKELDLNRPEPEIPAATAQLDD